MVTVTIEKDELVVRTKLTKGENGKYKTYPSESGKMALLASTHGFQQIVLGDDILKVSLNAGFSTKGK